MRFFILVPKRNAPLVFARISARCASDCVDGAPSNECLRTTFASSVGAQLIGDACSVYVRENSLFYRFAITAGDRDRDRNADLSTQLEHHRVASSEPIERER